MGCRGTIRSFETGDLKSHQESHPTLPRIAIQGRFDLKVGAPGHRGSGGLYPGFLIGWLSN